MAFVANRWRRRVAEAVVMMVVKVGKVSRKELLILRKKLAILIQTDRFVWISIRILITLYFAIQQCMNEPLLKVKSMFYTKHF